MNNYTYRKNIFRFLTGYIRLVHPIPYQRRWLFLRNLFF